MARAFNVYFRSTVCGAAAAAWAFSAIAAPVSPGEVIAEPSTPSAIAVRWPIVGDSDRKVVVNVAYRKTGDATWHPAYPLFRSDPERVSPDNRVEGGFLFAGSVVDLTPDTAYELRLTLSNPGVDDVVRVASIRTTRIPRLPEGLRLRHVVPLGGGQAPGGNGSAADPFRGLAVALSRAEPGDVFALGAGIYAEGTLTVTSSGLSQRPIVFQGPKEGAAVLDGGGRPVLLDIAGRANLWFERLAFRNARTLMRADGANSVVIKRNRFEVIELGFGARNAIYRDSMGIYVADNVFVGPTTWPRSKGLEVINGVAVTGAGHVVAYNRFQNLADGVHNGDEGRLSASDIHNNDIDVCTDDGIEADYSDTNVRVFRNRITNCFSGLSFQPVNGGPVYAYRNVMLNLQYSPFKLHNDTAGVLLFHNTSVKSGPPFQIFTGGETVSDVVTRNNLLVGTNGPALHSTGKMIRCDFDNDAYRWTSGEFAIWNGATFGSPLAAKQSKALYNGRGAFVLVRRQTFESGLGPPRLQDRLAPDVNLPLLAQGSEAIDKGVPLANFNDGYSGVAPDLGCCEFGAQMPWFGPRPEGVD